MTSSLAARCAMLGLAFATAAGATDAYLNARTRNALLEVPDGRGGLRDSPSLAVEGDGSIGGEGVVEFDPRTMRYQWTIVGSFASKPYGDWPQGYSSKVAEALVDFDAGSSWLVEAGKKRLKIGSGYFRRPSDLFAPDPARVRSQIGDDADRTREGLIGLGAMWSHELGQISLFGSPELRFADSGILARHAVSPQKLWQIFLRGTTRWGETDIDLMVHSSLDSNRSLRPGIGLNLVSLAAENTELHLDAHLGGRVTRWIPRNDRPELGPDEYRYDLQALLGVSHTFTSDWNLILEYFHNGTGLAHSDYDRAIAHARLLASRGRIAEANAFRDSYGPLSLATHYAMSRLAYTNGGVTTLEILSMMNLQDAGGYAGFRAGYNPMEVLRLNAEFGTLHGGSDTEAGSLAERWHTEFGLELFL